MKERIAPDTLTERARQAAVLSENQRAQMNARRLRRLLAHVCGITGPIEIKLEGTEAFTTVEGHRIGLYQNSNDMLTVEIHGHFKPFLTLSDLGKILEAHKVKTSVTLQEEKPKRGLFAWLFGRK